MLATSTKATKPSVRRVEEFNIAPMLSTFGSPSLRIVSRGYTLSNPPKKLLGKVAFRARRP
jgi:hypothetical protein